MRFAVAFAGFVLVTTGVCYSQSAGPRWTEGQAQRWYSKQPWLVGCNYLPANAINQLEMWQAETFDPRTIDKELTWAQNLGFNTLRVYLHDLVWSQDPNGLARRIDKFLDIAGKHKMRIMFVLFDDCHWGNPKLGGQPLPLPKIHSSGWVNSPARELLLKFCNGSVTEEEKQRLKDYVQGVLKRFEDDARILAWDIYNEPGRGYPTPSEDKTVPLLKLAWKWAQEIRPSQPLTGCLSGTYGTENRAIQAKNSDIITFHNYSGPNNLKRCIREHKELAGKRPVICTEYMARTKGSTFQDCMPIFKEQNVGCYNWGFVAGKSGTIWPWSSRENKEKVAEMRANNEVLQPGEPFPEPELWFHDIYRVDGTPFSQEEINFIKKMTGR